METINNFLNINVNWTDERFLVLSKHYSALAHLLVNYRVFRICTGILLWDTFRLFKIVF